MTYYDGDDDNDDDDDDKDVDYEVLLQMGGGDDQTQDQSSDVDWQRGLMGLSDALLMERSLNRQLLAMAQSAQERNDFHVSHFDTTTTTTRI